MKQTLVIFPGAWANRSHQITTWWFRYIAAPFRNAGWDVYIVTYQGKSLLDFIDEAEKQIQEVPDGAYALCYSLGAQVARGVCQRNKNKFKRVSLVGGIERTGLRFRVLLHFLLVAFWPIVSCLLFGLMYFRNNKQVQSIIFSSTEEDRARMLSGVARRFHTHCEHRALFFNVADPITKKTLPGFPCQVLAVVPRDDFFVSRATYKGEHIRLLDIQGDHGVMLDEQTAIGLGKKIMRWFIDPNVAVL